MKGSRQIRKKHGLIPERVGAGDARIVKKVGGVHVGEGGRKPGDKKDLKTRKNSGSRVCREGTTQKTSG